MSRESSQHPLINFLEQHADDRAMLAALRRGLGRSPGSTPEMFPYVMPFVRGHSDEEDIYLIASLFALHPTSVSSGNMGDHLRDYIKQVGDAEATNRRFVRLLRLRREMLDTPLRQHISLLKSKEVAVNWNQLLVDVQHWSHDDYFVQKNWAKAFWS